MNIPFTMKMPIPLIKLPKHLQELTLIKTTLFLQYLSQISLRIQLGNNVAVVRRNKGVYISILQLNK